MTTNILIAFAITFAVGVIAFIVGWIASTPTGARRDGEQLEIDGLVAAEYKSRPQQELVGTR